MAAIAAVVIFIVAYGLIATGRVHRTAAALGGAGLMLLIHLAPLIMVVLVGLCRWLFRPASGCLISCEGGAPGGAAGSVSLICGTPAPGRAPRSPPRR
ncbi:hypothetical protein ACFFMN_18500 [Planobispora siamensis]|uniref:Uncharacterized protein n=1 Tax=Planobispora siamensis TaxID=936338 RepID=A0A8J3SL63_9ACTN|nr:hypothetical protein [Planobispora siamensis]GIH94420.1 hypothetical protein Psi01_50500 [Planobispora siamensis]